MNYLKILLPPPPATIIPSRFVHDLNFYYKNSYIEKKWYCSCSYILTLNKSKNIVTRAEKIALHFRCILLSCGLELLFFLGGGCCCIFAYIYIYSWMNAANVIVEITLLLARAHEKVDLKYSRLSNKRIYMIWLLLSFRAFKD